MVSSVPVSAIRRPLPHYNLGPAEGSIKEGVSERGVAEDGGPRRSEAEDGGAGRSAVIVEAWRGVASLLVGAESRQVLAENEGVDVVGAFVSVDGLDVAHVPSHLVLVHDAVRAQDLASDPRAL